MQVASITDTGRERRRNEDCYLVRTGQKLSVLAVADGMGGHVAGDVASRLAIAAVDKAYELVKRSCPENGFVEIVKNLFHEANNIIREDASLDPARQGMGTTLTLALLCGGGLVIGHVGDSRAYLVAGERIDRLTSDHSLVEQMILNGEIDPDEAHVHPQRHILTRALGTGPAVDVDLVERSLDGGEALLLCTDGLTSLVREEELLGTTLKHFNRPRQAVAEMVSLANTRGGLDNITVVLATGLERRVS